MMIMDFTYLKQFMDHMAAERTPGNAIEVYVKGKKVFQYACGYSDLESQTPMTGEEYFNIYSCSKVTTVTAAAQLLERGKFLLSDPLYDYIPEFKDMSVKRVDGEVVQAKNQITIRDLFRMSAGFTYDLNAPGFQKARELTGGRMDTEQVIRCIASDPLSFEPGTHWQYSICHDVLAGLVEIVSGMKFRDYVKKNLFEPLDMQNCAYHQTPEILSKMASQYAFVPYGQGGDFDLVEAQKCGNAKNGTFVNRTKKVSYVLGEEYDSGGAGISATISDYVKLLAALANMGLGLTGERILSGGTVELMRTNQLDANMAKNFNWKQFIGYGYGLGVRTMIDRAISGSNGSMGEFGWCGAAGAATLIDPERELAVCYAQHCLNPREEYYFPRLRNVIYTCLDK